MVLLVAGLFASLLILPILFSLKCDGTLDNDASWIAIWTPMWIVDFFQLSGAILYVVVNSEPEPDHDDDPAPPPKAPLADRLNHLLATVLFMLVQIFVLIRLDRVVAWSWFITVSALKKSLNDTTCASIYHDAAF